MSFLLFLLFFLWSKKEFSEELKTKEKEIEGLQEALEELSRKQKELAHEKDVSLLISPWSDSLLLLLLHFGKHPTASSLPSGFSARLFSLVRTHEDRTLHTHASARQFPR